MRRIILPRETNKTIPRDVFFRFTRRFYSAHETKFVVWQDEYHNLHTLLIGHFVTTIYLHYSKKESMFPYPYTLADILSAKDICKPITNYFTEQQAQNPCRWQTKKHWEGRGRWWHDFHLKELKPLLLCMISSSDMHDVVIGRILALTPKPNCRLIPPANSFNSCKWKNLEIFLLFFQKYFGCIKKTFYLCTRKPKKVP